MNYLFTIVLTEDQRKFLEEQKIHEFNGAPYQIHPINDTDLKKIDTISGLLHITSHAIHRFFAKEEIMRTAKAYKDGLQ